eukprot:TRINITY_DN2028_c0_g1_i1.p1 TRINITY_DN2028_c0_g1~~TRINITY_DN2028_c0_g1_i1.p1  ORF type:complete len:457 (-),score=152.94 TRINITY_DN2028_c0_g1_i1:86-1354(-)
MQAALDEALVQYKAGDYVKAISSYQAVVEGLLAATSEDEVKLVEEALKQIGKAYRKSKDASQAQALLSLLKPFFANVPKAKTGKIVRSLIDQISRIEGASAIVEEVTKSVITWAETEERTFLRLNLQTTLASCLFQSKKFIEALDLLTSLTKEVKKLDDKLLLVSIFLLESQIHHQLVHLPKARAALTSARTAANAVYCPPLLQASLDMQGGTLHAEENDYRTAYSYFYESYENFTALPKSEAKKQSEKALKYMLLTKIMEGSVADVQSLLTGKLALRYSEPELTALVGIAKAKNEASLAVFKSVLEEHKVELQKDPVISRHLEQLYSDLFEDNLLTLVSPFSEVEIDHVAELIQLELSVVEKKLSQMILDSKLNGILDQGKGCLIVFEDADADSAYPFAQETITNIGTVVESLHSRAGKLR